MPYELSAATGGVNCYLLKTTGGFFLVDTGFSLSKGKLEKLLARTGCFPGNLKLVIVTHADIDHTGNCLFLQEKFKAKIAMHPAEAEAAAAVKMTANRKNKSPLLMRAVMALFAGLLTRPFQPDAWLRDGERLSEFGLDAAIIHTPGHTLGSVSVLTDDGDLFCGDFLKGTGRAGVNTLADDAAAMEESYKKIKNLKIKKIYPGHGRPFTFEELLKNHG